MALCVSPKVNFHCRTSTGGPSDGVSSPTIDKVDPEYQFIRLEDMEIVATLGMGGFGRVELVSLDKWLSTSVDQGCCILLSEDLFDILLNSAFKLMFLLSGATQSLVRHPCKTYRKSFGFRPVETKPFSLGS